MPAGRGAAPGVGILRLVQPASYPRTAFGLVRQCAWCWRVEDESGSYALRAPHKLPAATHGICPGCRDDMKRQIEARPAAA